MSVYNIPHDTSAAISPANGGYNSERFVLNGSNIHATITGLNNTISYIDGSHDAELLNRVGGTSIVNFSQNLGGSLSVADLKGSVHVYGFLPVDTFTQYGMSTAAVRHSMHSDGHGGTMIGRVDFVDTHVTAAQVHGAV